MRQIIATTKEGLATNKGLATGKKGSVTTEQSLATIKEGLLVICKRTKKYPFI